MKHETANYSCRRFRLTQLLLLVAATSVVLHGRTARANETKVDYEELLLDGAAEHRVLSKKDSKNSTRIFSTPQEKVVTSSGAGASQRRLQTFDNDYCSSTLGW